MSGTVPSASPVRNVRQAAAVAAASPARPRGGADESGVMSMPMQEPEGVFDADLSALRVHDAAAERVERIRARCVSVLEARRSRARTRGLRAAAWRGWLEPVLALGLGALYLAEAVTRALAVYRRGHALSAAGAGGASCRTRR